MGRVEMTFSLKPSKVFLSQVREFSAEERLLIAEKLELAKLNPFRYKSLSVPGLSKVLEMKITLGGLYSRIVYTIHGSELLVECVINRKNDFRDLLKLLYKARKEE